MAAMLVGSRLQAEDIVPIGEAAQMGRASPNAT